MKQSETDLAKQLNSKAAGHKTRSKHVLSHKPIMWLNQSN